MCVGGLQHKDITANDSNERNKCNDEKTGDYSQSYLPLVYLGHTQH